MLHLFYHYNMLSLLKLIGMGFMSMVSRSINNINLYWSLSNICIIII